MFFISFAWYWNMQGKCTNIIWGYAGGLNPDLGVRMKDLKININLLIICSKHLCFDWDLLCRNLVLSYNNLFVCSEFVIFNSYKKVSNLTAFQKWFVHVVNGLLKDLNNLGLKMSKKISFMEYLRGTIIIQWKMLNVHNVQCYHSVYMFRLTNSQFTHNLCINAFTYCYLSVNVISLARSQSDHIKRRPL